MRLLFFFSLGKLLETEENVNIFDVSNLFLWHIIRVHHTKSLLTLFWYDEGMDCDGKRPKHLYRFFWVACLSLSWYTSANTQPGIWLFFSGMGPVEKQKKLYQRWRKITRIFPRHRSEYSWLFLLLLLFSVVQTRLPKMLLPSPCSSTVIFW